MRATFTILTLVTGTLGLFGQGHVAFDNNPYLFYNSIENGGTVEYKVFSAPGIPVADSSWSVQLFQAGSAIGGRIPFYGETWLGVWNVSADPDGTLGFRTLNTGPLIPTTLEVVVFDGAGIELARCSPFPYTAPSPYFDPYVLEIYNFRGFVVPEPSAVALWLLGLGALGLFRLARGAATSAPNESRHPTPGERLGRNRMVLARRGCVWRSDRI